MENERSYDKFYLKRNPATGEVLTDGKVPNLGECAKRDCRIEPRHAKILNSGWENSGVYFVEVKKEEPKQPDKEEQKDQAVKIPTKKELVAECEGKGLDTNGNVKQLNERLANHKAE